LAREPLLIPSEEENYRKRDATFQRFPTLSEIVSFENLRKLQIFQK
jgi:hypothetical protein